MPISGFFKQTTYFATGIAIPINGGYIAPSKKKERIDIPPKGHKFTDIFKKEEIKSYSKEKK